MDNSTAQKLKDAITKAHNIGIVVGENPSLDEMAAALSLSLLLQGVNKKTTVASPTQPIVAISSLVGINKVQGSLGGESGDLVVSFPYQEGEIEKVSYTLEQGFLNIVVKAANDGLSFDEKDVKYTKGSGSVDLLFVIGAARLSDLGAVFDSSKLKNTKIVNFDNDPSNQGYGDIVFVSDKLSTLSELIGDMALVLDMNIDIDVAQNLLSGIVDATKNLQDPRTSALALEIVSIMMKRGAVRLRDTGVRQQVDNTRQPIQENPQFAPQSRVQQVSVDRQAVNENVEVKPDETQRLRDQIAQLRDKEEGVQGQKPTEAPTDWLAPKVYKGSSNF